MRKSVLIVILFLFFVSFISLNAQWARTYGGGNQDGAYVIQQTTDGGYIIGGYTFSSGAGLDDFWVLKLTPYGEIEWQKTYGGIQDDYIASVQQTTDGGYILMGSSESFGSGESIDIWILKLNSSGDIEWQKNYNSGAWSWNWIRSIQQTTDNGYIIAAYAGTPLMLKLSADGSIEWQKIKSRVLEPLHTIDSIQQTVDNGYIIAGVSQLPDTSLDIWICKISALGEIEWQYSYGGDYEDYVSDIQQTIDGGYIVVGDTGSFGAGGEDIWILKLDSLGSIEWQKTYGGNLHDRVYSIQQTTDKGYIIVSNTKSFGAGGEDAWVLRISLTGDIEWQKTYGESYDDSCRSIQQAIDGAYVVTGNTESFGVAGRDIWVLKLSPTGDISQSCDFIQDSDIIAMDTFVLPQTINITLQEDTVLTSSDTDISPKDTTIISNLLCEARQVLTINTTTGGTTNPIPDTYDYPGAYSGISIAEVDITAIPDTGYRFDAWTGDIPEEQEIDNPITIIMDSDKSITANFIREYTLTIAVGQGGTTNPAPSTYVYDIGTEVQIEAISDENYRFTGWTGDASGTTNPITMTMDLDKSVTANFIRQYELEISAGRGGTTSPSSGTYTHDSGIQVSIQATANSGYRFIGWSDDVSGTTNPITITMDSDKSVKANFEAIPEPSKPEPEKGGCFIATAAYGSPLHPHIDALREFRDKHLMTNKPGRTFVKLYYKYSPPIANFITKHKFLKSIVRDYLYPLVAFSYLTVR